MAGAPAIVLKRISQARGIATAGVAAAFLLACQTLPAGSPNAQPSVPAAPQAATSPQATPPPMPPRAVAAAPNFYNDLLSRGVAQSRAGNHEEALRSLRVAAFGLLDEIAQFETAQIYIAISSFRLGREADARHALQRLLAAERIERRFAALSLPPDVRTEIERIAATLLTSDQLSVLRGS